MPSLTIYLAKDVHERVEDVAKHTGCSVSKLIAKQFPEVPEPGTESQLDRIEKKLDLLIPKGMFETSHFFSAKNLDSAMKDLKPGTILEVNDPNDEDEIEFLKRKNSDLLKKRGQLGLDENRQQLVRKKGESNAAWQIRKKVQS